MDKEKDSSKERDLGFFNGIKAEAIPLIAGLVSFTLLVEKAVNNISDFFSISEKTGTILFVIAYFIVPVAGLIIWITLVNYHDGLKKRIWDNPGSKYSWPFLLLLVLLILLCLLFLVTGVLLFTIVAALVLLGVTWLAFELLRRRQENTDKFRRERYQAKWQFIIVFTLLVAFWVLYLSANFLPRSKTPQSDEELNPITTEEYKAREAAMRQCLFDSLFCVALDVRADSDTMDMDVNTFMADFQDYIYRLCPCDSVAGAKLNEELKSSFKKIVQGDSCSCQVPPNRDNQTFKQGDKPSIQPKAEFFSIYNAEAIKLQLDKKLATQDKKYRIYWSAWLRTVQYRGLVLFALTALFLLVVWYYAYTARLDSEEKDEKNPENFSEINISKISIYIIFLLIIPFFKPITRENTVFAKPYITFNNPLTLVDNSNTTLLPKIEFPEIPKMEYDVLADTIKNVLERRGSKLHIIDSVVRKEPVKKSKKS